MKWARRGRWAVLATCAFASVSLSGPPAAHAETLVRSVPANGAALSQPPHEVALFFDRKPDSRQSHVSLRGPGDVNVAADGLREAANALTVTVSVTQKGDYAAFYHVVFSDGGYVLGSIQFSLGTGTPPVPIPSALAVERAQAIASQHTHGVDPVGAFLLFLDLLAVVVVAVLLRLNRPGRGRASWRLPPKPN